MLKDDCKYIAAIIINYGTADLTVKAVESVLLMKSNNIRIKVFVVDNCSPKDDVNILNRAHSSYGWGEEVEVLPEKINSGFGSGNNVVLERLKVSTEKPEFVFFLNPDAYLQNDVVSILASRLQTDPNSAAAGALVLREGTNQPVVSSFRFPTFISESVSALGVGPIHRLFKHKTVAIQPSEKAYCTDWVTGAAFMVKFSVLEDVGFFDPSFFLYYEETELMHRIRAKGYNVWFHPKAKVIHAAGAATGMKDGKHEENRKPIYIYDSWRIYFVKTHGIWTARFIAVSNYVLSLFNLLLTKVTSKKPSLPTNYTNDFWHYSLKPLFTRDPTARHFPAVKENK